jgi:type I restriction enzyme S subunit
MSLPRYPAYKDSGVAWLGVVPEHWNALRSKIIFEIKKRISGETGFDVLSITQQGIKVKDIESNDGQLSMDYAKYQFVYIGDFAMNHMDLLTGYVDIAKTLGVTSPDYRVFSIRDKSKANAKFFLYLLQNGYKSKIFYAFGQGSSQLGRWRLPTDAFNNFVYPVPDIIEQTLIAQFLDRETSKIDDLISEQSKLITLLDEKRQAMISHAVTKGLNPDAPMKDSGVEWLGEVPEHWQVKRVRFIGKLNPSKSEVAHYPRDLEVSFLPMDAVGEDGSIRLEHTRKIEDVETGYTFFRDGDVTIAKITPCFENGKGAVMRNLLQGFGFGTTELIVVRPKQDVMLSNFVHYIFISTSFRKNAEGAMYGAGGQKRVPDDFVRNFNIGCPQLSEQRDIISYIDQKTAQFDTLKTEAQRGIELLKERRSALISAAVTGKIDVRGVVNTEAA